MGYFLPDPGIETREESFTPLHFAAQYTPQIIDKDVQSEEVDSSKKVMEFLTLYNESGEVQVLNANSAR